MNPSEAIEAAEKIHNYFRHLHATPNQIGADAGAIKYLRGELEILLAESRKLANLTTRPGTHHEAAEIVAWFLHNPLTRTESAHRLNVEVSVSLGRRQPYGTSRFREAMETLGYIRTVDAAGTSYSPPRT